VSINISNLNQLKKEREKEMYYKLVKNNVSKSKSYGKWYARAAVVKTVSLEKISEVIQRNCSMKRSDVNAVLTELPEVMRDFMDQGCRVMVNGLGAFKLGIRSAGADDVMKFNVREHVKAVRVLFQPEAVYDASTGKYSKYLTREVTLDNITEKGSDEERDAKAKAKEQGDDAGGEG